MPRAAMSRIDRAEARHLRLRQAGRRLVEQDDARLAGQRAREFEQPALAERQRRYVVIDPVLQADELR